jgi:hypothetical protein
MVGAVSDAYETRPYETRTVSVVIAPRGEPTFCREATAVRIEDDGGGEFVVIEQVGDEKSDYCGKLAVSYADWPAIRDAVDKMIAECRS